MPYVLKESKSFKIISKRCQNLSVVLDTFSQGPHFTIDFRIYEAQDKYYLIRDSAHHFNNASPTLQKYLHVM